LNEQVLDDGYEKQEQVKWREAQVVDNAPASADDSESSRVAEKLAWLRDRSAPWSSLGCLGCVTAFLLTPVHLMQLMVSAGLVSGLLGPWWLAWLLGAPREEFAALGVMAEVDGRA